MIKNNKGITLVALVVTIIVLLILAGITIATITNSNSAPEKAAQARDSHELSTIRNQIETAVLSSASLDGNFNLTDVKNVITNNVSNVTFLNDEFPLKVAMNNEVICTVFDDGTTRNFEIKEYIKSTGTQYIDTGVTPANTVDFELTMKTDVDALSVDNMSTRASFFGTVNGDIERSYGINFGGKKGQKKIFTWKNRTYTETNGVVIRSFSTDVDLNMYNMKIKKVLSCINDTWKINTRTLYTSDSVGTWKDNNNSLVIFGASKINNNVKTISTFYENLYVYGLKIWDNGTLIRDFIPVVSFESGHENEACLYDLVNGEFYYNNGTGNFETN